MLRIIKVLFTILISLIIISLSILSFKPLNAIAAETVYLRVLVNDAYLYGDADLTQKIFKIPYGYFVKAENVGSTLTRVVYGDDDGEYPVIMGYMKTSDLKSVNIIPVKPFAVFKVSTATSDILFNDGKLKKPYFNVNADTFMYFYGEYDGETSSLCYVYCKNKLGYVDKSCLNPFTVPTSPDEIVTEPEIKNDDKKDDETVTTDNSNAFNLGENLQIIIIAGISIISISVVYFLFKPPKQKRSDDYALDNEDE